MSSTNQKIKEAYNRGLKAIEEEKGLLEKLSKQSKRPTFFIIKAGLGAMKEDLEKLEQAINFETTEVEMLEIVIYERTEAEQLKEDIKMNAWAEDRIKNPQNY